MKSEDARLAALVVGCAVIWIDTFAFANYGFICVLINVVEAGLVWSLLKLRRMQDEFYIRDVQDYVHLTVMLDVAYAVMIFLHPTFTSAFVLIARCVQFFFMIAMFPKDMRMRREPYAHWITTEFKRDMDLTWRQEITNAFSFEMRRTEALEEV